MKKIIAAVVLVLAFAMLTGIAVYAESGYGYGESVLSEFEPKWDAIQADETVISVAPGGEQGELGFGWLSKDDDSKFMISENADMSGAKELDVNCEDALGGYVSNKVTATGLEEGKTYYYSYTENGEWSEPAAITVQDDENFTVLFISDAQIGRSGDEELREVLVRDTCGWNYTVSKMMKFCPDAAFMISGGDQFQSAESLTQMKAYLSPEALRSLPVANTIGNHDKGETLYGDIFNNPNEVNELLADKAGTGYFYTYGDALFITVNSNNNFLPDTAKVIREAVKAYPDAKWRVVTMHHNPYSAALASDEFSEERLLFSSLYDCYDIDLVLSGHDHFYSRTQPVYAGESAEGEGTVYVQSSSASGSNYDPLPEEFAWYTETAFDVRVPTFTAFTFTENAIIGTTYRTDTDEIIDAFEVADNTSDSTANVFTVFISMMKTLIAMI